MAIVYLARDVRHGRQVALKVLLPEIAHALGPERFLREIAIAAQLAHPNILPLHDSGDVEGLLYYVMPYVDGDTLRDRLERSGRLPAAEALQVAGEIADALAYAHARGLIHRDIKPENILFQAGHAVLSDFGIARAVSGAASAAGGHLTDTGMVIGTAAYMSPEQAVGSKDIDGRTDIYSLGCVLVEMLLGIAPTDYVTKPQPGEALTAAMRRHCPDAPPMLAGVIAKAVAWQPEDRFPAAGEFRRALASGVASGARGTWGKRRSLALVAAVAMIGLLVAWPGLRQRLLHPSTPAATVKLVVLPFANLSADSGEDYFSDGLTEEMITQLGRLDPRRLGVIARVTAMRYKNSDKPLEQIGRELGVTYALEGSARREAGRVRITAQLIRVLDQTQLWAESYDREMSGILAVQGDVARGVANSLALALLPAERERLARARPVDPQAYEAYLRGREHSARLTREDLTTGLAYFELALHHDSSFAPAWVGIAKVWSGRQQMGYVPPAEAQPQMRQAVARALALDSTLAIAHYRLAGIAVWSDWDWATGEAEFRKATDLDPTDAEGRAAYAHFLAIMRRPSEANEQMGRAIELDPLNPQVKAFNGVLLALERRYADALDQFQQVRAMVPDMPMAINQIPNMLHLQGRDDSALAEERALWMRKNDGDAVRALDRGSATEGYRGAVRAVADLLAARARRAGTAPALVHAYYLKAGDPELAMQWLEHSFRAHDPNMPYIDVTPMNDPLRRDRRFQALVRALKLPS